MYDMANPVTVKGSVKRFEWTNPHAFIFLDVKDDKGATVEWEIELMSLNHLRSLRLDAHDGKPGDVISCTGGAATSGAPSMISARDRAAGRPQDPLVTGGAHDVSIALSPSRSPAAVVGARSRRRRQRRPRARRRARSPYQEAGTLPARIMEFKAEPSSIKPGESTTLTWAVENPRTTTIEPTDRARDAARRR